MEGPQGIHLGWEIGGQGGLCECVCECACVPECEGQFNLTLRREEATLRKWPFPVPLDNTHVIAETEEIRVFLKDRRNHPRMKWTLKLVGSQREEFKQNPQLCTRNFTEDIPILRVTLSYK